MTAVLEGKPVSLATVRRPEAALLDPAGFFGSLSLHLTLSSDNQKFNRFIEYPKYLHFRTIHDLQAPLASHAGLRLGKCRKWVA